MAAQCLVCFPESPCKFTAEEISHGVAVQTYETDLRTGDAIKPLKDGGSCPQDLHDECQPYGLWCFGKACSATVFDESEYGPSMNAPGGYSLAPPHYPFKEGNGYRKAVESFLTVHTRRGDISSSSFTANSGTDMSQLTPSRVVSCVVACLICLYRRSLVFIRCKIAVQDEYTTCDASPRHSQANA